MKILIVDDNADNLEMMEIVLKSNNYIISSAVNGRIALNMLEKEDFDLIISDILMPVMDGFQLCRECKSNPKLQSIPFVFYTATYIDYLDEEFAMSLGSQDFIRKPQEPEAFLMLIKNVIEKSKLQVPIPAPINKDEKEILKLYSERLISKLEKKNLDLENEVAAHKKTVEELIKAKEKAEQSDKLKTAFLTNMSHEMRTPMNGIIGFSALLLDPMLPEKARLEYANIINTSCTRLLNTVNDVLDISILEAGQMDIKPKHFNLSKLLKELYELQKKNFERNGIAFKLVIPEQFKDVYIDSDEQKIYQILSNLLNNSLKFTNKGEVEFGFNYIDNLIEFFVKDTGIGISQDALELIFGRFNQENYQTFNEYEGSGLGLSIAKGLVELLGGKIYVNSHKGVGSIFRFTIPCNIDEVIPNTISIISEPLSNDLKTEKHIKVLIAEDDYTNFILLRSILKKESNFEIIRASNGLEAVKEFKNHQDIGLVLMDIKMPLLNGIEATKQIREINHKVPIIAITAYALVEDREMALLCGCNDYISKPFQPNELIKVIMKYIE